MKPERVPVPAHSPGEVVARLRVEHERLEARLRDIDRNMYLTPDEQFERKRIQKLKLRTKDRIQQLIGIPT